MYLVTCGGNWEMCECWGVLGGVVVPHTLAAPEAGAGGGVGSFSLASTCPCLPVRNPLYTLTRNLDLEALTRETAGGAGFTAWQGAARETRHLTNLETTTAATANARLHHSLLAVGDSSSGGLCACVHPPARPGRPPFGLHVVG